MLLDVVSLFENQERQSAWEAYCGAVAAGVERKKPFVLRLRAASHRAIDSETCLKDWETLTAFAAGMCYAP